MPFYEVKSEIGIYEPISQVASFARNKHKRSEVLDAFTLRKPIKTLMFFCRFHWLRSILKIRNIVFLKALKRKKRMVFVGLKKSEGSLFVYFKLKSKLLN